MKDSDVIVKLTRREAILCGMFGAAGLLLGGDHLAWADLPKTTPSSPIIKPKAKAVIQLWMWGGPSHLDTFDPKPGAGDEYMGQFMSPIKTNVDGIMINELLPELAKHADKYSILRSVTHNNNGHETAAYIVQSGNMPGDNIVHPGIGAIVSLLKGYGAGYTGLVPPYVVLTELLGRFSESGFLGSKAAAFATGGDPNQTPFRVEGVVASGVTSQRQRDRRDLLHNLNSLGNALPGDPSLKQLASAEDSAYELILGDAGKVFDLSQEKDDLRNKYGRSSFGQSCLLARRLVERGVPYVAINFGGWDTHKQNFPAMRRLLPQLDKGMSALLQDLSDHGLLDSTIVWWGGEFGRTPKVMWEAPWNGGRSHWGQCFSMALAGGGFQGGHVIGASDKNGEQVADRPVYPNDIVRSILVQLGIDPDTQLTTPTGTKVAAAPSIWSPDKKGGLLTEIM
jgi:hypothetical protein